MSLATDVTMNITPANFGNSKLGRSNSFE